MSQDTPLIFTTLGNVPIDSLEFSTQWEDSAQFTKFIETYKRDGVVVKQSAHVMVKNGFTVDMGVGSF